jgi:hypothetical protein
MAIVEPEEAASEMQRLSKHVPLATYMQAKNRETVRSGVFYTVRAKAI